MTMFFILIQLLLVHQTNAYFKSLSSTSIRPSTLLFGSKHHGRYGNFADALPRQQSKKVETLASQLNLPSKSTDESTGAQLRSNRIRNLKIAQKSIPIIEYTSPPGATRNWSDDEINNCINILNLTYENKSREDLTDNERIGLIDWDKFDTFAMTMIPDYATNERVKTKVISWILYHRKKMDIRLKVDTWVFDPKGSPKRLYKRLSKKTLQSFAK